MAFPAAGFQYFPQVVSASEVAALLGEVAELCTQARRGALANVFPLSGLKAHRNPGVTLEEMGREPFLLTALPEISPVFERILLQENLWALAAGLLETDDVVYHFSNLTRKPARIGPNLTWHRDYPNKYICPAASRHFFRLLIPLEEMDSENGCTLVVPQTHLVSDEQAVLDDMRPAFDPAAAGPLTGRAGDAFAIHPKVVHGGTENRSARDRNLIVVQFAARTSDHLYWCEERFTGLTRSAIVNARS